jgi:hypothetical protein
MASVANGVQRTPSEQGITLAVITIISELSETSQLFLSPYVVKATILLTAYAQPM